MLADFRRWALNDDAGSRRQAAWGRRYRIWLALKGNPLAMLGLAIILACVVLAALAPVLAPYDPTVQELTDRLAKPSAAHLLGTDELGRDILSRLLYGGRVTLGMVIAVVVLVAPLGLAVGTVAGFFGGWVDTCLMRVTDVFLAFPRLILALAFVAALSPGVESTILAIALTAWPPYARIARAETLTIRHADFIEAAAMTGASPWRIVARHVAPLCVPSLIVRVTLDMSSIIITAASLGFLGMGAQPPSPEWGAMIATAKRFILDQYWVALAPCVAILMISLAFNFLGDGLRDVLDPKQS
ncbi:cytochrome C550 [Puniceibacterium antarcticum]|uniref:Cytochrome C550 n=1 Tax=Puniceibacterium antarcticum TaxID=1206336 RepID=A0A2G8REG1_9RHOB|nr:ABC transporter permease [Puniceibacterium antarcticum]PIL19957.1 cytochrome C550 [Puniceibacterium antarcticum]